MYVGMSKLNLSFLPMLLSIMDSFLLNVDFTRAISPERLNVTSQNLNTSFKFTFYTVYLKKKKSL